MEAGYLGVGAMGQPMSHKLLDAGHSLTIYDGTVNLADSETEFGNNPASELADWTLNRA